MNFNRHQSQHKVERVEKLWFIFILIFHIYNSTSAGDDAIRIAHERVHLEMVVGDIGI